MTFTIRHTDRRVWHVYAMQTSEHICDKVSNIDYIDIIHTTTAFADIQFPFAVKAVWVASCRKVRSIHPVYFARRRGWESLYPIILNAGRTRSPYVIRFRDQLGFIAAREKQEEILVATSWATSREKSYRISMPRCLPNVCSPNRSPE